MQPWVAFTDCGEKRIHQDKLGAVRGSRRDGYRSAIAGDYQSRGLPEATRTWGTFAQVDGQWLSASHMLKSRFLQPSKGFEAIGVHDRARYHILLQESQERYVFEIWDHSHASAPGCPTSFLHGH